MLWSPVKPRCARVRVLLKGTLTWTSRAKRHLRLQHPTPKLSTSGRENCAMFQATPDKKSGRFLASHSVDPSWKLRPSQMIPPASLDDIKVLDLSQGLAGPLCAKILGDFGAEVLKVEPPQGDAARSVPPYSGNDAHPEKSLLFLLANLNKRGVKLNLETAAGQNLLRELARKTDVIVESFPPGYLASLGLDYESLSRENPGLVVISITPFGQTGPYSGYSSEEIVTYALSGIMSISGMSDREPIKHGGMQSQFEGGLNGALATSVALYTRDLTGEG